jgi:hypothetical protein
MSRRITSVVLTHPATITISFTHPVPQLPQANKDPTWASQNYLSQRALTHATSVRSQLAVLLEKAGVDCSRSCAPEKDPFLKCLTAGEIHDVTQLCVLFILHAAAMRVKARPLFVLSTHATSIL